MTKPTTTAFGSADATHLNGMSKTQSDSAKRQRPAGSTKFTELRHHEANPTDLSAMATPGVVEVEDTWGDKVEVTPGQLNDATRWIYRNGQCLALAVAIAEEKDWPVVIHMSEYDPEALDEDGDPESATVKHAYAQGPDGTLYDIDGMFHPEAIELSGNEILKVFTPGSAAFYFESDMSEQDYDTAASFTTHALLANQ